LIATPNGRPETQNLLAPAKFVFAALRKSVLRPEPALDIFTIAVKGQCSALKLDNIPAARRQIPYLDTREQLS